jgi:Domain of unknown function (DUF4388)
VTQERVRISTDGRIAPVGTDTTPRLCARLEEYEVHDGPDGMWLLLRESAEIGQRERVLMMGELTTRTAVLEILNVVTSTSWRGELHIVGPTGRRALEVDQGALKHARTDFEGERLGEQLVKAGHISRHDLLRLLGAAPSDRRLGQLLVEQRLLTEELLFAELRRQAESIFYAALLVEQGMYWFVQRGESAPPSATSLHLPIHALLMEGVQRIDEMALYRERLPHNRLFPFVPAAEGSARKPSSDPHVEAVLALCDGKHNIDAIGRRTALGEFATLKIVYGLLRSHKAQLLSGPSVDPKVTARLVRLTNDIMRDVFIAVATYGRMESTREAISQWLSGSEHARVLGTSVDVDGTLDRVFVQERLEKSGSDDPMSALHQALHELCAFALLVSGQHMPRREEQLLARDVQHRLKQLVI